MVKVHALVVAELKSRVSFVLTNRKQKQRDLIDRLSAIYTDIRHRYGIPLGDFPPVDEMQRKMVTRLHFVTRA